MGASGVDALIFDDDPEAGELARCILTTAGYTADLKTSGERVLELARAAQPRLVVLDVMMPGLDGVSACRALRGDPSTRALKVVVVSGRSASVERERALRHGADAFVEKPVLSEPFLELVRGLIGGPAGGGGLPAARSGTRLTALGCGGSEGLSLALEAESRLVLLDGGAALARGAALLAGRASATVLLSRAAPGHVEGLGAALAAAPALTLDLLGPDDPDAPLADATAALGASAGRLRACAAREGPLSGEGWSGRAVYSDAPGLALLYRVETEGKVLAYAPVSEGDAAAEGRLRDYREKLRSLLQGADALVHRGRDEAQARRLAALAVEADVKRLLFVGPTELAAGRRRELSDELVRGAAERFSRLDARWLAPGERVSL